MVGITRAATIAAQVYSATQPPRLSKRRAKLRDLVHSGQAERAIESFGVVLYMLLHLPVIPLVWRSSVELALDDRPKTGACAQRRLTRPPSADSIPYERRPQTSHGQNGHALRRPARRNRASTG